MIRKAICTCSQNSLHHPARCLKVPPSMRDAGLFSEMCYSVAALFGMLFAACIF